MSTNVVMPQMGESIAEGTIVRWIKKVGDEVDRDEPLFEISTDKVDAEIPSPAAGLLAEIRVKEGETVPSTASSRSSALPVRRWPRLRRRRPSAEDSAAASRRWPTLPTAAAGRRTPLLRQTTPPRTRRPRRRRAPAEVVAARAPHRARAQRRHHADSGHRDQRPGDQAGHPRVHRVGGAERGAGGGQTPARRSAPAPAPRPRRRLPARRERAGRADERDAQEDRRAHGAQRAHLAARLLGLRGQLRARQRAPREEEGRVRSGRREADVSPPSSPRSSSMRCGSFPSSTRRSTAATSSTRRTSISASPSRSRTA